MSDSSADCVDDDYSCDGLCLNFLDVLSVDIRRDTSNLVHDLCRTDVEDENAKERCTEVIIRIERELGPDHFTCELVIKVLTELLRKICMLDCAIELINEHMERKQSEDVGCLILLSRIYGLFGDYRKTTEPLKKAHQLAKQSGEPLLLCLVLVKEACNLWHLKDPEKAQGNVALCESTLEDSGAAEKYDTYPFTDSTHRLMDVFKTLGYIYRIFQDTPKSIDYYLKGLNILEKDAKSVTQIVKLETVIARSYVKVDKELTRLHCMKVYKKIKSVSSSEIYMTHHSLPMIHCLARVTFSMENVGYLTEALEIYEYVYDIAVKYLGQNHPEVARLAADNAYLCNRLQNHQKEDLYVQKALAALECGSVDLSHIKLHVREISDAWKLLGSLFSNKRNFEQSEKCYKEAVSMNIRVYGCSHPRLIPLYKAMGYLYKRNDKFPPALDCFRKCLEISRDFNRGDNKGLRKLSDEIDKVKALQRRKNPFPRTQE